MIADVDGRADLTGGRINSLDRAVVIICNPQVCPVEGERRGTLACSQARDDGVRGDVNRLHRVVVLAGHPQPIANLVEGQRAGLAADRNRDFQHAGGGVNGLNRIPAGARHPQKLAVEREGDWTVADWDEAVVLEQVLDDGVRLRFADRRRGRGPDGLFCLDSRGGFCCFGGGLPEARIVRRVFRIGLARGGLSRLGFGGPLRGRRPYALLLREKGDNPRDNSDDEQQDHDPSADAQDAPPPPQGRVALVQQLLRGFAGDELFAPGREDGQLVVAQQRAVALEVFDLLLQQFLCGFARLHGRVNFDLLQQVVVRQLVRQARGGFVALRGAGADIVHAQQPAVHQLREHGLERGHRHRRPAGVELDEQFVARTDQPVAVGGDEGFQHALGDGALIGRQVALQHALEVSAQDAGRAALRVVQRARDLG